ncbi:MAG: DUF5615 family PIN-like protein [Limisphaerales bacterium]
MRFSPSLPIVPTSRIGRNPSDSQIGEFARKQDLIIVSKDADYSDRIINGVCRSERPRGVADTNYQSDGLTERK